MHLTSISIRLAMVSLREPATLTAQLPSYQSIKYSNPSVIALAVTLLSSYPAYSLNTASLIFPLPLILSNKS